MQDRFDLHVQLFLAPGRKNCSAKAVVGTPRPTSFLSFSLSLSDWCFGLITVHPQRRALDHKQKMLCNLESWVSVSNRLCLGSERGCFAWYSSQLALPGLTAHLPPEFALPALLSGSRWNVASCSTWRYFGDYNLPLLLYPPPASWSLCALFDCPALPVPPVCPCCGRLCLCAPVAHRRLGGCVVSLLRWLRVFTREDKVFSPSLPSQACFLRRFSRCLISDFVAQPSCCLMGSLSAEWVR